MLLLKRHNIAKKLESLWNNEDGSYNLKISQQQGFTVTGFTLKIKNSSGTKTVINKIYRKIYLIIGKYLALFSIIIQRLIAKSTTAITRPDGAFIICVKRIPTITGKIIIAPNALYLFVITSMPPTISATAISGISQVICIKVCINFIRLSGISFGMGM
jgi:hypothetical protein